MPVRSSGTHIICLGNSTLDRVWPVEELPTTGGKFRASDYLELGGGVAANAAVAVARLGGHVAYWGRGGDDTAGHSMRKELADYQVDVTNYRLFPSARSPVSAILVGQDGERIIINFPGADLPEDTAWLPFDQVSHSSAVLADIRWIEAARGLYSIARSLGIPTVLDGEIATADAFTALLPLVDHAIFSEPGLGSFINNLTLNHATDYLGALQKVRTFGCCVAAVTCGVEGTLWLDDNGPHHQPAFAVKSIDTTGAGDAFHGAYTLALGEGSTIPQAMRFASAVAALKCTRQGGRAGIPHRSEVEAFLTAQGRH